MKHRRHSPGFTLAEMMVAVAIFTALMAGLAMLFTGTLRAVRQGYLQQEAFENARAALTALKNDLTISSGSEQHADYHSFYGTPIGMTFVGVARTSDDDPADLNIARITYVVYDMWNDIQTGVIDGSAYKEFPEALEDDKVLELKNAYVYVLLRYVEPGVGDLESFPIFREGVVLPESGGVALKDYLEGVIDEAEDAAVDDGALDPYCDACVEGFRNTKRRELWIRMLSGGDWEVPNAWDRQLRVLVEDPDDPESAPKSPYDYVAMEHVLSIAHPEARFIDPADPLPPMAPVSWRGGTTFFDYDYAENYYTNPAGGEIKKGNNTWWNDYRSLNCRPPTDEYHNYLPMGRYCRDPRLPEVVGTSFWVMYDSPYPGAPEFKRRFSIDIFLPVGYAREKG